MRPTAPFHISLPRGDTGPGVLLLHEAWGLTGDMVWAADRLAGHGYAVVVPDLSRPMGGFAGAVAQLVAGRGPLISSAMGMVGHVAGREEVTSRSVGVVGFSMGAALGLLLARHPRVSMIAANYGMVPPAALRHRDVPVVASFGERDRLLPRGSAPLLRKLRGTNQPFDIEVYEGVGHSFMTPDEPEPDRTRAWLGGFDASAADHAWNRMIEALGNHLETDSQSALKG